MALDWVECWRLILPNHCTGTCEHRLSHSWSGVLGRILALGVPLAPSLASFILLFTGKECLSTDLGVLAHARNIPVWAYFRLGFRVKPRVVGSIFVNSIVSSTSKTPIGDLPAQLLLLWVLVLLESPFALTWVGVDKGEVIRVVRANACSRQTLRLEELLATS